MKSIKDLKQENEMASTMKAAAIEEMRAELEQAGYNIGIYNEDAFYCYADTPDKEWQTSYFPIMAIQYDLRDIVANAYEQVIPIAYRHLKQSQFLARLAELREELASKKAFLAKDPNWHDIVIEDTTIAINKIEQEIVKLVLGYKNE